MPRGRKSYTTAEKLEKVLSDIAKKEEELKALKEEKKELEASLEKAKLAELSKMIDESGLSIDEIKELLANPSISK